jgi:hypothetical protein
MVINREPWNMDYYLTNEFKAQPYRSAGDRASNLVDIQNQIVVKQTSWFSFSYVIIPP